MVLTRKINTPKLLLMNLNKAAGSQVHSPFLSPTSTFHIRVHKVDGKSSNIQSKNIPAWIRKHIFCNRFNKQNICQEQMAGMKLNGEFFICFKLHKVYIGSGGDGGDPKKLRDRSWNCIIIDNKKSCDLITKLPSCCCCCCCWELSCLRNCKK